MKEKEIHLNYIDCIRGIAILLVILGHSLQFSLLDYERCYLYRFIYSFHMPLFMFISGFVAGKNLFFPTQTIWRRFKQLIIPFFSWPLFLGLTHFNNFSWTIYLQIIDKPDNQGLWFLWSLFFITLLYFFCSKVSKLLRQNPILLSFLLAITLPLVYHITKYNHFGFNQISWLLLYFWLGLFIRQKNLVPYISRYYVIITLSFIILFFFYIGLSIVQQIYYIDFSVKTALSLLGSLSVVSFCFRFYNRGKVSLTNIFFKWVEYLGTITLGLYAVHFPVLHLYTKSLNFLPDYLTVIFSFLITIIISVIIVRGLKTTPIINALLLGDRIIWPNLSNT